MRLATGRRVRRSAYKRRTRLFHSLRRVDSAGVIYRDRDRRARAHGHGRHARAHGRHDRARDRARVRVLPTAVAPLHARAHALDSGADTPGRIPATERSTPVDCRRCTRGSACANLWRAPAGHADKWAPP